MTDSNSIAGSFTIKKVNGATVLAPNEFIILIPVFGVDDAWDALKIGSSKLRDIGQDKIHKIRATHCNQDRSRFFLCRFEFISSLAKSELQKLFPWSIYSIGEKE